MVSVAPFGGHTVSHVVLHLSLNGRMVDSLDNNPRRHSYTYTPRTVMALLLEEE